MRTMLEELPDGIHSGLAREGAKGVFFFFSTTDNGKISPTVGRVPRQHFWRYVDLSEQARGGRIEDNRYVITNQIQCQPDTPRVVPMRAVSAAFLRLSVHPAHAFSGKLAHIPGPARHVG